MRANQLVNATKAVKILLEQFTFWIRRVEQSIKPVPGLRAFFMSYSTSTNNSVLTNIDNDLVSSGKNVNQFSSTSVRKVSLCDGCWGGPPLSSPMVIKETLILLRSHVHTRQWRTELTHRLKVSVFTFNSKALINHSQMTPTIIQNIFKDADHWCSVLCHSSLISILFRMSETYRGGSLARTLIEYRSSKTLLFCSKKYSIFRRC